MVSRGCEGNRWVERGTYLLALMLSDSAIRKLAQRRSSSILR